MKETEKIEIMHFDQEAISRTARRLRDRQEDDRARRQGRRRGYDAVFLMASAAPGTSSCSSSTS